MKCEMNVLITDFSLRNVLRAKMQIFTNEMCNVQYVRAKEQTTLIYIV